MKPCTMAFFLCLTGVLGFAPVAGCDVEAASVAATRDGARENGVEVEVSRCDLRRAPGPWAPTVTANLARSVDSTGVMCGDFHVHTNRSLDSDRAGISAVKVHLRRNCDLEGATEIPSDEPDTRRFERIISVVDDFQAVRSYSFEGGCITYRFDFDRQGRALVNEVSVAIGFIDRSAVDALGWSRALRGRPIDGVCERFRNASEAAATSLSVRGKIMLIVVPWPVPAGQFAAYDDATTVTAA